MVLSLLAPALFSLHSYSVACLPNNFVGSPESRGLEFESSADIRFPKVPGSFTCTAEISRSLLVSYTPCTGAVLAAWECQEEREDPVRLEKCNGLCCVPSPGFRALVVFQECHLEVSRDPERQAVALVCTENSEGMRPLSLSSWNSLSGRFLCSLHPRGILLSLHFPHHS